MGISYADINYYYDTHKGELPKEAAESALMEASRHIDALTYNRITGRGLGALTDFQQDIIKEACCRMADFEQENAEMIQSVFRSYSINGVSMEFGQSWNIHIQNGIAVRRDIYEYLCQTGLCCRSLGAFR